MISRTKPTPSTLTEAVIQFIEERYSLKSVKIDAEVDSRLKWRPSCHWKTDTGFIACEISNDKPYRPFFPTLFNEIFLNKIPIRMISAFPAPLSENKDYKSELKKVKDLFIGLLCIDVDDNFKADLIYPGITIPLHIGNVDYNKFCSQLKTPIQDAYELYTTNPKQGVQELGQLIEKAIINLATQALAKKTLKSGGFNPSKYYAQANLIEDLIKDRVIDNGILGVCRGYCNSRNDVSHKPKNKKEAQKIESELRGWFEGGLTILEKLPAEIKKKGYKFKV